MDDEDDCDDGGGGDGDEPLLAMTADHLSATSEPFVHCVGTALKSRVHVTNAAAHAHKCVNRPSAKLHGIGNEMVVPLPASSKRKRDRKRAHTQCTD